MSIKEHNKEDEVDVYKYTCINNEILLSIQWLNEMKWNLAICNNTDGLRGYYAKQNKSERNTNTIQSHLYVESKNQNKRNKIDS